MIVYHFIFSDRWHTNVFMGKLHPSDGKGVCSQPVHFMGTRILEKTTAFCPWCEPRAGRAAKEVIFKSGKIAENETG